MRPAPQCSAETTVDDDESEHMSGRTLVHIAAFVAIGVVLAGCRAFATGERERPSGGPPAPEHACGPPPAWVETASGSHWLYTLPYSYWRDGECPAIDGTVVPAPSTPLPVVNVRRGEKVIFHLDYTPDRVELRTLDEELVRQFWQGRGFPREDAWRRFSLPASASVSWEMEGRDSLVLLTASVSGRDDAYYEAWLKLR